MRLSLSHGSSGKHSDIDWYLGLLSIHGLAPWGALSAGGMERANTGSSCTKECEEHYDFTLWSTHTVLSPLLSLLISFPNSPKRWVLLSSKVQRLSDLKSSANEAADSGV